MKYKVVITNEAQEDLDKLDNPNRSKIKRSFEVIEQEDIECIFVKFLGQKLFEIKSGRVRALFTYREDKLVVIGVVFLKNTQKTPQKYIKRARKILEI